MTNYNRNTDPAGDQPAADQTPSNERRSIRRKLRSITLSLAQALGMRAAELASTRYLGRKSATEFLREAGSIARSLNGLARTLRETHTPRPKRSTQNRPTAPSHKADSPVSEKTKTPFFTPETPETPENKGPEAHQEPDSNDAQSRFSAGSSALQHPPHPTHQEPAPEPDPWDPWSSGIMPPSPPMWIPGYDPTKDKRP